MRRVLHRLLAGSAAALVAAAAVAAAGTPALAATAPSVSVYFPDISVAAGTAKINPVYAWVDGPDDVDSAPVSIAKLTVTVETAAVAGFADVEATDDLGRSCSRGGTLITCTVDGPMLFTGESSLMPLLALQVTGKSGADDGASGKLTFTTRADSGAAATGTSTVTVGEGVDLAGFLDTKATEAAPGSTVDTDLRVANSGAKTVHGVVLLMLGWDPSLVAGNGFSNCTYGLLTVCTFDGDLETGTTYELSSPMQLRIPADAAAGSEASAIGSWYTPSDFQELLTSLPGGIESGALGTKGTGSAVRLQAVPVKPVKSLMKLAQVDTEPDNNVLISEVVVGGKKHPDEGAVGATIGGAAGDQVDAKVGFVNNGPGTLYHWTFDNTDPSTRVSVPAGLKVVKADDRCEPGDGSDYLCFTDGGSTKAAASTLFDFTFEVRSASAGRVTINEDLYSGGDVLDSTKSDNTAPITVTLTGGGSNGAGGSGGDGGGLPVTGSNAALVGGAGALLALGGVFGLVFFRRRRVRFTA